MLASLINSRASANLPFRAICSHPTRKLHMKYTALLAITLICLTLLFFKLSLISSSAAFATSHIGIGLLVILAFIKAMNMQFKSE